MDTAYEPLSDPDARAMAYPPASHQPSPLAVFDERRFS